MMGYIQCTISKLVDGTKLEGVANILAERAACQRGFDRHEEQVSWEKLQEV